MKKIRLYLYVSNHYGGGIVGSRLGNGKISLKVSMGLLRQKGGSLLQFVDKEGHRVL
jgi:cytochrome c oxidase subunit 3